MTEVSKDQSVSLWSLGFCVMTGTSESEQKLGLGSGQGRARDNLVGSWPRWHQGWRRHRGRGRWYCVAKAPAASSRLIRRHSLKQRPSSTLDSSGGGGGWRRVWRAVYRFQGHRFCGWRSHLTSRSLNYIISKVVSWMGFLHSC